VPAAHPSVVVLSGPNGAGKSTTATRLLVGSLQVSEYVDADVFARTLPRSEATAITAGRGVLRRLDELATERRSFGFETTLASRSFGPRIRRLIGAGYECHLVFLWLPSADLAVARVADRVRLGGHSVPEATIRRRYRSGLRNFFRLYQALTTTWRMYDNSEQEPRLVASGVGRETLVAIDITLWRRIREEARDEG
jgi:predicted ABC-type ATPase